METKRAAFNALIDRDLPLLRAGAYRILGNVSDVDDAVQEALLTAWKKFDSFRQNAKLSSWVYRITVNICFDRIRKRQAEQKTLEAMPPPEESVPQSADQRMNRLTAAIAELPEQYREAVTLGCLSDFPGEKAAEMLGCSRNTLYQRIYKAKQLLKLKMETGS